MSRLSNDWEQATWKVGSIQLGLIQFATTLMAYEPNPDCDYRFTEAGSVHPKLNSAPNDET